MLEFAPTGFIRGGLPCRQDCGRVFRPVVDTVAAIGEAALERNTHELDAHRYIHVALEENRPQWANPTGRGGKPRT